jgi:Protein of unknown function (DUF3301)
MIESLLPLLLLLGGFYAWQNAMTARETARRLCHDLCARAHLQLLDQTVALRGLRLIRVPARGLLLRRDYCFEFSADGKDRHRATMSMLDEQILVHNLPIAANATVPSASNVVVLTILKGDERREPIDER